MKQMKDDKSHKNGVNNKKKNLLWQIDFLEAQLNQSVESTRLKSTKAAADREIRRYKYKQRALKKDAASKDQTNESGNSQNDKQENSSTETPEEIQRKKELRTQINTLKKQLVEQKIHHGIIQIQRTLKKSKTLEVLKVGKALKRLNKDENTTPEEKEVKEKDLEKKLKDLKSVNIIELSSIIVNRYLFNTYINRENKPDNSEKEEASDNLPEWIPESISQTKESFDVSKDTENHYQHFSTLKNVFSQLEELVGIINFAVGLGEKVRRGGEGNELTKETEHEENEKDEDEEPDSVEKSQADDINSIEYHGRPLVFSDDEDEEDIVKDLDIEKLKKDKKVVSNTSTLNYDDISDSEGDEQYYNEISEPESDDDNKREEEEEEEEGSFFEELEENPSSTEPKKRKRDDENEEEEKSTKEKKEKKEKKKIVLPALLNTFVGASDDEEDMELQRELKEMDQLEGIESKTGKTKKNRPGQRERRAIAERKYGRNCNHLKTERDKYQAKRAQLQAEYEAREAKRQKSGRQSKDSSSTAASIAAKEAERKRLESKPLHPSWEAKKKLAAAATAQVKFAGKKIVFD